MRNLINIAQYKLSKQEEQCFSRWPSRLGYTPGNGQTLADLPDSVLLTLAELGPEATLALYDLVLGVRQWGAGEGFTYLEPPAKMEALDSFLFMADQMRFEVMRRLGWLEAKESCEQGLVALASSPRSGNTMSEDDSQRLTTAYPDYGKVSDRMRYEPQAVVRSIIPQALQAFREKIEPTGDGPIG
jgi:hypothetical protein